MSVYLYLPFGHEFVRKNRHAFNAYMNSDCFPEQGVEIDPETAEEEYLLLSGKEVEEDVDFESNGKMYKITCMMTVEVNEKWNDIWNVCTPIPQRKQGYLARLFEKYWEWFPNVTTRLYVVAGNTKLLEMYKKFGFKVMNQSKSEYTMERKFKKQRSTRQTTWRSRSMKR